MIALAAVLCGGLAVVQLALADEGGAGGPAATPSKGALAATGQALFSTSCASCHGIGAGGVRGRGPSLRGVGALAADFYLETGRMPLSASRSEPLRTRPAFPQRQIEALVAYVASFGGPPIPEVKPQRGSLADGERLFAINCAGCHTIQGQGGIVTGAIVPSLNQASPTQVGEAVRVGPYVMPRFSAGELSAGQIDSIARYVQAIQHPEDRGGWGIGRIGPIPEGMVAWLLGAAALVLVARLIGERRESDPPEPGTDRG